MIINAATILLITLVSILAPAKARATDPWWQSAVIYQIWPSSFYDTNADGIGDLNGIISRISYLKHLGVTALWLNPILKSPSYHGYDTSDFKAIDPRYGTLSDFSHLIQLLHQQNLRILFDLTINHVSVEHPWFKNSEVMDPKYSTYFIWKSQKDLDGSTWRTPWSSSPANPKQDWKSVWHLSQTRLEAHRRAFPDALHAERPIYYYAVFGRKLPDLNFREQKLRDEIYETAAYWLKEGVDGFRIDGARYLIEDETANPVIQADSSATIGFWKDFGCFLKQINPEAFLVAEIWANNKTISAYYQKSTCGLDAAFDFTFGNELVEAIKAESKHSQGLHSNPPALENYTDDINTQDIQTKNSQSKDSHTIDSHTRQNQAAAKTGDPNILNKNGFGFSLSSIRASKKGPAPWSFFAPFLSNHDQVRFSQWTQGRVEVLKAAATALLTAPGTPFIYYGEEIGQQQPQLKDSPENYDDLFKRAPFFWSTEANAGFSTGAMMWVDDPLWFPWRPNHKKWWDDFFQMTKNTQPDFSLDAQMENKKSLWQHYQRLLALRKNQKALRNSLPGSMKFMTDNGTIAAYRRIDENQQELLVLINPTETPREINLTPEAKALMLNSLEAQPPEIPTAEISPTEISPTALRYQDLLSGQVITTQGSLTLAPFESLILKPLLD